LTVNLALDLDYFSTLGTVVMTEFEDNSVIFIPYYSTDLGGGLEFRVDGNMLFDSNYDFYSGVRAGLTYYF